MPSNISEYGTFFKFEKDEVFRNRIKTHPKVQFFIYSGSVYYNNESQNAANSHTPDGHLNLYDLNVHRDKHPNSSDMNLIYSFITKGGSFTGFKTISKSAFNQDFVVGDTITNTYPLTASISIDSYPNSLEDKKKNVLYALKTSLDYHSRLSPHYAYSSSYGDKEAQSLNIISIPSIFYGSSIKKGSVVLKYHVSGALIAEASDIRRNGELVQTSGSSTGQIVGLALYNEGFLILTASAALSDHQEKYSEESAITAARTSWQNFGVTSSAAIAVGQASSSYNIDFKGTNYINTITMLATAKENKINYSTNPTFVSGNISAFSGSSVFYENDKIQIKNIISSSYKNYSASFEPVTYISKIGIYDKNKNLIAIAGLANPVKKTEDRAFTFKLKLDI